MELFVSRIWITIASKVSAGAMAIDMQNDAEIDFREEKHFAIQTFFWHESERWEWEEKMAYFAETIDSGNTLTFHFPC